MIELHVKAKIERDRTRRMHACELDEEITKLQFVWWAICNSECVAYKQETIVHSIEIRMNSLEIDIDRISGNK